jgi:hypothetical protein
MQLRELRAYAAHRRLPITAEFIDQVSGTTADRLALERLWQAVRARKLDTILVWKFDRFARSTKQLIDALEESGIWASTSFPSRSRSTPLPRWVRLCSPSSRPSPSSSGRSSPNACARASPKPAPRANATVDRSWMPDHPGDSAAPARRPEPAPDRHAAGHLPSDRRELWITTEGPGQATMRQVPEDMHRGGDPWRLACIARESFIGKAREDCEDIAHPLAGGVRARGGWRPFPTDQSRHTPHAPGHRQTGHGGVADHRRRRQEGQWFSPPSAPAR